MSLRRKTPKLRTPWQLWILRVLFAIGGRVAIGYATSKALNIWFSTRRFRVSSREKEALSKYHRKQMSLNDGLIVYYTRGTGPRVLMLHGWNGRAGQFVSIADALVEVGYSVVLLDAPGHGLSSEYESDIFQFVDALIAVQAEEGEYSAVIGHSFGSMALLYSLRGQLSVDRFISISAPAYFSILVDKFAEELWLPSVVVNRMRQRLLDRFGEETLHSVEPLLNAEQYEGKALIIHDDDDQIVPRHYQDELVSAFRDVEQLNTQRQGHFRILRSKKVIAEIVRFLTNN